MTWLRGGPFLEVSFLLPLDGDRQTFLEAVLVKLKSFSPAVEIALTDKEVKGKIQEFGNGCWDNEQDLNSFMYHSTRISIYMDTEGKRKCTLSFEQISSHLIEVNFWFFGSEMDEPAWNQKGITETQIPIFKKLLHNLFDSLDFIVGTVGYEVSTTDLFDTEEDWPNEKYNIANINMHALQSTSCFLTIIANKKYLDLGSINTLTTSGQKQILERINTAHIKN